MFDRIDHGAGGLIKRIQLGTLFIAVSLLFCASAFAAEPEKHLPDKHNPDQRKAPASAAERAEERKRNLRDKHNPDQHKDVSDGNWHTMYFDPGDTNIYVTCEGVPPEVNNNLTLKCKTSAVWAACPPNGPSGSHVNTFCQCASHADEQHSGQYRLLKCPSGK